MARNRDTRAAQIEDLLAKSGRSLRWLAVQCGETPQKVHNWITGENHPRDPEVWDKLLEKAREAAGAPQTRTKGMKIFRTGVRQIPVYGGMQAGTPGSHEGDVEYIEIPDWGNLFERWGRVIIGYSMDPVIQPGDIVVFESSRPVHGHIVHAYSNDGEDTCKVWTGERLEPINQEFEPILMDEFSRWVIKGVAVMVIRSLDNGGTMTLNYPSGMRHKK